MCSTLVLPPTNRISSYVAKMENLATEVIELRAGDYKKIVSKMSIPGTIGHSLPVRTMVGCESRTGLDLQEEFTLRKATSKPCQRY